MVQAALYAEDTGARLKAAAFSPHPLKGFVPLHQARPRAFAATVMNLQVQTAVFSRTASHINCKLHNEAYRVNIR
jgi:hypothetical protein